MKKKYTYLLLVFVFGLFFSQTSFGQIVANNDQGSTLSSANVQIVIQNVLGNDTINGIPATLSDVTITQISSTSANVSVQPNGNAVVNANIPYGTHIVTYQICSIVNSTICDFANVTIVVTPPPPPVFAIGPDAVTISSDNNAPQIILENILSNDTIDGIPITISDVSIISQVSSTVNPYFEIDTNGNVLLTNSGVPPGVYTLEYLMCQTATPFYCYNSNYITVTVINSLLTNTVSAYQDFNGDGITNVGDLINYTYTITNIGAAPVSNVSITSSEVNINGGPPIPLLNNGASDTTTYTGIHVITQEEINSGQVIVTVQTNGTQSGNPINVSSTNTVALNLADGIHLVAFVDYNGNGTPEFGESYFHAGTFQYEINNNGTVHNISTPIGGPYLFETNPANSYDFNLIIAPPFDTHYTYSGTPPTNVTVPNNSGVVTYYFPVTEIPFNDLSVYLFSSIPPKPGFEYFDYIYYTNNGNYPTSGTITFTNSNVVSITNISQTGSTLTPTGFTYNFTNLYPGQTGIIGVRMLVPTIPTVNLGDLLTNSVTISSVMNDMNLLNNSSSLTETVIGSYDPNDKAESHGPQIQHSTFSANDYLTYTIRFENTGTAEAINIRVNDVLDADLDETTVRMVTASHPYVLDRVGSNLTWRFDGVNLEPSIPGNSVIGHGYIVFQVKPESGFIIGDVIPNTANIYFDFNPAIVTNTWSTEFVLQLSNPDFAFNDFDYYPNPVKNSLTISSESIIETAEIYSVLGQKVKSISINNLQAEIDLSELNRGMYFVKVSSLGQEKTVKIIKE